MNILIASSGKQIFLIQSFRESLDNNDKIITCDSNSNSPTFKYSDDFFILPKYEDDNYIDFIINKCIYYNIKLLITLSVEELIVLQRNRLKFNQINHPLQREKG